MIIINARLQGVHLVSRATMPATTDRRKFMQGQTYGDFTCAFEKAVRAQLRAAATLERQHDTIGHA